MRRVPASVRRDPANPRDGTAIGRVPAGPDLLRASAERIGDDRLGAGDRAILDLRGVAGGASVLLR